MYREQAATGELGRVSVLLLPIVVWWDLGYFKIGEQSKSDKIQDVTTLNTPEK